MEDLTEIKGGVSRISMLFGLGCPVTSDEKGCPFLLKAVPPSKEQLRSGGSNTAVGSSKFSSIARCVSKWAGSRLKPQVVLVLALKPTPQTQV